ncbi:DUF72 domain-containing protein [Sphingobium phenoxybenzoativorans]|uniref:DUF72 domain-containing protein n=1 Tax=Sphingobium phenoxybenzoativorans TaxID=1592790 RepID=A0A975Q1I6_9SPHN|nr:DUF72 domain-containing protein [Sphingobium phenoxybenzoativorans]QUT05995.1 DUF72 domain-containing protein [Sphingobium phenoxybenzoativorans]
MTDGRTGVGIGGWTFEPWRGTFYPQGLKQKDELAYAASRLTAIEINGTYYSSFKPESFRKWADAAPDGFVFTVKASRFCTNRRVLADGGESVQRFVNQGLSELGDKLGPILWQFMATKKFDADDFGAFLALLPKAVDGVPLRHALEVRHESFRDPAFIALAKAANAAIVYADHDEYPLIEADAADFAYARLMRSMEDEPAGYAPAALDDWAAKAQAWRKRGDAFVFFISGAKARNPAAAIALIERVAK